MTNFPLFCSLLITFGMLDPLTAHGEHATELRRKADLVLEDLKLLDSAIDQWAIENGKSDEDLPSWKEIARYVRDDARLRVNDCKDELGNKFIIGTVGENGFVHPQTLERLAKIVDTTKFFTRSYVSSAPPPAIILAAREGDALRVVQLLKLGADIDQTDSFGRTSLFWAARMGHIETARVLCAMHRNPLAAINAGGPRTPYATPLLQALSGHADIVELFLSYGATVPPMDVTYAVGHVDVLKLLLSKGLSPNACDSIGRPILQFAAAFYPDSVRVLIDAGADVNAKWRDENALQTAIKFRKEEIVQILRAAGAKD